MASKEGPSWVRCSLNPYPVLGRACILSAVATGQVGLLPREWAAGALKACPVQC